MGENIAIRLMKDCIDDYTIMSKWLTDVNVLQYYGGRDNPRDIEKTMAKYTPRILGKTNIVPCFIQYNGSDIGYIQYYKLTDDAKLKYGYSVSEIIYGIDLFIGETEHWNKGIGSKAIRLLIEMLAKEKNADGIIIDPQTWNIRAIKCYEKCGFKKVKLLPENELLEGEYKDNWLMEINL